MTAHRIWTRDDPQLVADTAAEKARRAALASWAKRQPLPEQKGPSA